MPRVVDTNPVPNFIYRATVVRWVDGDTADLDVDIGFKVGVKERFRLSGINTPEMRPKKADFASEEARQDEIKLAQAALDYASKLAPEGSQVIVETFKDSQGKYGRWLAKIYVDSHDQSINDLLLQKGHAKPY
jgi:micrococcal nuclease